MTATQLNLTLLAAWRQRDRESPWGRRLIAALILLMAAVGFVLMEGPARWALPGAALLIAVHGSWMVLGFNLQEQNHPNAARHLPGHLTALRAAALTGWALASLLTTLLTWALLPPGAAFASWQALLLGNAAVAVFTFWSMRAWWLWVAGAFIGPALGALRGLLEPPWMALVHLWHQQPTGMLALALLAMAGLVVVAFGTGDARHRQTYDRQRLMRNAQRLQLQGKAVTPAEALGGLGRITRPFDAVLWAWRDRVVARADNQKAASVLERLELVLHGNQHWTYQLMGLGTTCVLLGVIVGLVLMFTAATLNDLLLHGSYGIVIGWLSALLQPVMARSQALWQSRREQALLRLLPGVPQGADLNRGVAWLGLRQAGAVCLLLAAALLPLAWATDLKLPAWAALVAVPWAVAAATRPSARMRAPSALTGALPMLVCFPLAAVAEFAGQWLGWSPQAVALPVLLGSAALGLWRWRRLAHEPAALPAGRLA